MLPFLFFKRSSSGWNDAQTALSTSIFSCLFCAGALVVVIGGAFVVTFVASLDVRHHRRSIRRHRRR